MMSELCIQGLTKRYGDQTVLDQLDLTVKAGTLLTLLGPSGSGKTTLLRLLCGFERSDSGSITLHGQVVSGPGKHVAPEHRNMGYVPQEGALFPHLSVADNIVFGLPRAQRRQRHRVAELLDMVGLPADYANRPPQQLSGGQQQRVALARALAPSPSLVLLDEPFSALDASLRSETRQAVMDALQAAGATALMVTHDQSEALSMGEQVAVLWQGKLLQVDSPQNLYRHPTTLELAAFVGESIVVPGRVEHGRVVSELGVLTPRNTPGEGAVQVLIRPEQLLLGEVPQHPSAPRATVTGTAFYGHDACVRIRIPGVEAELIARVAGHHRFSAGQEVAVRVHGDVAVYE